MNTEEARSFLIKGARVLDPVTHRDEICNVCMRDGMISALGQAPDGFQPDSIIDAEGHWLLPGLVDLAARLREPGQAHKATIGSECRAAVAAGVTDLCVPPDSDPVVDTPAVVDWIGRHAQDLRLARVHLLGGLTQHLDGSHMAALAALKESGCVGVGNARHPVADTGVLRRLLEYATSFDLNVFLHPLDVALADGGCAHEGPIATRMGLPGSPSAAETAALARDLAVVEQAGARVHFCRLSSARSADLVADAQRRGLPVSADVAAHQLFLTDEDIAGFNPMCHLDPPVRSREDREHLRTAVREGVIGAICSDHQPHEADAKTNPFPLTEPGISALETFLPLGLKLVQEGALTPLQMADRVSAGPARTLGIDGGSIEAGQKANVCLIAADAPWMPTAENLLSAGKNSPFLGVELPGRVTHTWVDGRLVHDAALLMDARLRSRN